MPETRVGWEIYGKFYSHNGIEALRHGDFALVRQVTGMTTDEFVNGDDLTGSESGWIAVAFWQGNPEMSRDMAARAMQNLKLNDVERIGFELDEDDGEQSPPVEEADSSSAPSESSSTTTGNSSEETPVPSPSGSSGQSDSVTGHGV